MVKITVIGRDIEIAPYKLGSLLEAAPHVDAQKERLAAIRERAGVKLAADDTPDIRKAKLAAISEATTTVDLTHNIRDGLAIIHVGVAKAAPDITITAMIEEFDATPENVTKLLADCRELLKSGGMKLGE